MHKGKAICKQLKSIRKIVADANGIEYIPTPCTYEGECSGTCPKCEEELAWISEQIKERLKKGEPIAINGIASEMISPIQPSKEDLDIIKKHITNTKNRIMEKNERIESLEKMKEELKRELECLKAENSILSSLVSLGTLGGLICKPAPKNDDKDEEEKSKKKRIQEIEKEIKNIDEMLSHYK